MHATAGQGDAQAVRFVPTFVRWGYRGIVPTTLKEDMMCLTCGCMDAHLEMGQHNITFEDIKAAAEENGKTVAETFEIFDETLERDRTDHPDEYSATADAS